MFLILTASKDAYVTDKIINNDFRAEDSNTGRAATIDIFKLWQESTWVSGSTRPAPCIEFRPRAIKGTSYSLIGSRLKISNKFDIEIYLTLHLSVDLKMYDVMGGQAYTG